MSTQIPIKELNFEFARSGGPGGQNVNKLNTKVHLTWNFEKSSVLSEIQKSRFRLLFKNMIKENGEVMLTSQRFRVQARNIADCTHRLQEMVDAACVVPKKRFKTKPGKAAVKKRLEGKRISGEIKKNRAKIRPSDI